jgi:glycosyltransferase involved in cell wall biosynthesis
MRNPLKIVAIIPLYNGAKWIEQSIRSVLAQTLKPDEVIIVDDGSTDAGPTIVKKLISGRPSVRLLRKENGGQSSARNYGVKYSKGSLIAFLDQDDAWYRTHLEELIKPFKERQPIPLGWAYSNLDEADESCGILNRNFLTSLPVQHPKLSLFLCLRQDMFVLPSASLISREAFDAVGGFDERLSGYEDDDLFLRIFRAGYENIFLNKPLSVWRIYTGSTSFRPVMARSRMIYAQKLFSMFPDDVRANRYLSRDLIAPRFLQNLIGQYLRSCQLEDRAMHAQTIKDFKLILPKSKLKHRLPLKAALLFMRSYTLSIAAYRTNLIWLAARILYPRSLRRF